MLKGLWTIATSFVTAYRTWFVVGSAVAVFALIAGHLALDNSRIKKLSAAKVRIEAMESELVNRHASIVNLNKRISDSNARQLEALEQAAIRIKAAEDAAEVVRIERDVIAEDLEVTRFEILEAIRDDEDMADWVDWDVPVIAWQRLRDTAGD